jgi:hypothetical protein
MRTLIATAALLAMTAIAPLPAAAQAGQSGTGAYCLKEANNASSNCGYQTMAQCEKSKISQSDVCSKRMESTGMAPGGMSGGSHMAPSGGMGK